MGNKRTRNKKPDLEIELHVLSNEPQPWKYDLMQMLYTGSINNQLGYMDAMNKDTGELERLLVGLQLNNEGKVDAYPIARFLEQDEITKYLAPDGKGAYGT